MSLQTQSMGWLMLSLIGLLSLASCSGGGGGDSDTGSITAPPELSASVIPGEPPEGSPRFLTLPYDDESVAIFEGWYYNHSLADLGCQHPFDKPPLTRHCAVDYVKGDPDGDILSWASFPVVAAAPGLATLFVTTTSGGTIVFIEHDEVDPAGRHFYTEYLHLATLTVGVPVGESVRLERGDFIAMAGATGTRPIHLHFNVGVIEADGTLLRVDPYDLAGGLLRSGIRPIDDHYEPGAGCGPNHLWIDCPLD